MSRTDARRPSTPAFPGGARVAGVIWAVYGFGFLVLLGFVLSANHAAGGPPGVWLGAGCVGLALGGPFAVGGCRVAAGTARDTLVLSVLSVAIGLWRLGTTTLLLAAFVAAPPNTAPADRWAFVFVGMIDAAIACGWLLAAALGFVSRSRYREWRDAREVGATADRADDELPSAVWQAAARGDAGGLRRLMDRGDDPDAAGADGSTPLHAAARHGHAAAVEVLLAAGADANRADPHGNGPLWVAVHEACQAGRTDGNLEVIRLLVAAGADADRRNRYGRTPRENAEGRDRLIAALLPQRGRPGAPTTTPADDPS